MGGDGESEALCTMISRSPSRDIANHGPPKKAVAMFGGVTSVGVSDAGVTKARLPHSSQQLDAGVIASHERASLVVGMPKPKVVNEGAKSTSRFADCSV